MALLLPSYTLIVHTHSWYTYLSHTDIHHTHTHRAHTNCTQTFIVHRPIVHTVIVYIFIVYTVIVQTLIIQKHSSNTHCSKQYTDIHFTQTLSHACRIAKSGDRRYAYWPESVLVAQRDGRELNGVIVLDVYVDRDRPASVVRDGFVHLVDKETQAHEQQ